MGRNRRTPTRGQDALASLLAHDGHEPPRQASGQSRPSASPSARTNVPGFALARTTTSPQIDKASSAATDLAKLRELFGDSFDAELIVSVYNSCGCNLQRALDALLAFQMPGAQEYAEMGETAGGSMADLLDNYWDLLPGDIRLNVFDRLNLRDLARAAATSHEFAEHVRQLRSNTRMIQVPPGLTASALRGLVAAHRNAHSVSLQRCAAELRFADDFERAFYALLAGEHDRVGGGDVTALDLRSCTAMTDSDAAQLCLSMPHLREVDLSNCCSLTDAALQSLARYRTHDGEHAYDGSAVTAALASPRDDDLQRAILASLANAGVSSSSSGAQAAGGDGGACGDGGRGDLGAAIEAAAAARTAAKRGGSVGEGLEVVRVAGLGGVSEEGLRAVLAARSGAGRWVREVDVARCGAVRMAVELGAQHVLRSIKANGCARLRTVCVHAAAAVPLASLSFAACRVLEEVDVSSSQLQELNVSNCVSLRQLAVHCPALLRLEASMCRALPGLAAGSTVPKLRRLNLFSCRSLDTQGVAAITGGCPDLELLNVGGLGDLRHLLLPDHALLQQLDCSGCEALGSLLVGSPACHTVLAKGCVRLQEATLHTVLLRRLDLTNCSALRSISLPALAQQPRSDAEQQPVQPVQVVLDGCPRLSASFHRQLAALRITV